MAAHREVSKQKLSQLCEISTPGKLISFTREPSHVVYKSSTKPEA